VSTKFIRVPNRKFDEGPSAASRGRTQDVQSLLQLVSEGAKLVVVVSSSSSSSSSGCGSGGGSSS